MARVKNYRELFVWQKAMALARSAYQISEQLPQKEAFGLLSQIRRAAVSVPSNIAEGHGRLTDSQFRHFLGNARGSLYELHTQLELAADLGFIDGRTVHDFMEQGAEVARLLNGLISSLSEAKSVGHRPPTPLTARSAANSASSATKEAL